MNKQRSALRKEGVVARSAEGRLASLLPRNHGGALACAMYSYSSITWQGDRGGMLPWFHTDVGAAGCGQYTRKRSRDEKYPVSGTEWEE